jgi:hypothetical protein
VAHPVRRRKHRAAVLEQKGDVGSQRRSQRQADGRIELKKAEDPKQPSGPRVSRSTRRAAPR